MPMKAGQPTKPQTGAEWRQHAEELHARGLATVDLIENLRDAPAGVAQVHVGRAQMYFLAAQSATAMAGQLMADSTP